jgi:hypothetical protein
MVKQVLAEKMKRLNQETFCALLVIVQKVILWAEEV